jgi:hypothetical protein
MSATAEFDCECGETTAFDFEKPELLSGPVFVNMACRRCKSTWQHRFRYAPKGTLSTFKLLQPSQMLHDILMKRRADSLREPEKKSPLWVVPGKKLIV